MHEHRAGWAASWGRATGRYGSPDPGHQGRCGAEAVCADSRSWHAVPCPDDADVDHVIAALGELASEGPGGAGGCGAAASVDASRAAKDTAGGANGQGHSGDVVGWVLCRGGPGTEACAWAQSLVSADVLV